jgi:hypothetical protein
MRKEMNIRDVFEKKLQELAKDSYVEDITAWDVFTSLLTDLELDLILPTLKADLEILKLLASGLSASSVANMLAIYSKDVINVAKTWGMKPVYETVDFNPLLVYVDGMSPNSLMLEINEITPLKIDIRTAEDLIYNIERYHTLLDYLREEDE